MTRDVLCTYVSIRTCNIISYDTRDSIVRDVMCTKYVYVGFSGGLPYCLGDRCRLEDICQNAAASYFHFNQKGQTLRRSNALAHIRTCSIYCLFAHVQGNVARSKVPTRKASGPGVVEWRMSHGACERLSGFLYNAAAAHASCYIQVGSRGIAARSSRDRASDDYVAGD